MKILILKFSLITNMGSKWQNSNWLIKITERQPIYGELVAAVFLGLMISDTR